MNADKTLLTPLCKRLGATLSRRGMLFVGLGIVIIMSVAALLAPWLSPYDPTALHLKSILLCTVLSDTGHKHECPVALGENHG